MSHLSNHASKSSVPRPFTHGIGACCDEPKECICAAVCSLCSMCELAKSMDEKCWSVCIGGPVPFRTRIRTQRNIEGSICEDALIVGFCGVCALVQMIKEVRDAPLL